MALPGVLILDRLELCTAHSGAALATSKLNAA